MTNSTCSFAAAGALTLGLAAMSGWLAFAAGAQARQAAPASKLRFDVSFIPQAHEGPITGRVFVMMTRSVDKVASRGSRSAGPACRSSAATSSAWRPSRSSRSTRTDLGTPIDSIADIPAGDYFVQAMVVVYTEFHRADGHVVWMHDDQWEGQRWNRSPGNLYSAVQKIHIDPNAQRRHQARRRSGAAADPGAGGHEVRQADQVPEPDADEVLGPADLPRAPSCCCRATTIARPSAIP